MCEDFSTRQNVVSCDKVGGPGRHWGKEASQGQVENHDAFTHRES